MKRKRDLEPYSQTFARGHFSLILMPDSRRSLVVAGRFPWPAPIGYVSDSKSRTGANLVPDSELAPHVRRAFELVATGGYKKTDVLRIITDAGLRRGRERTAQTFDEMLGNARRTGFAPSNSCLPMIQTPGFLPPNSSGTCSAMHICKKTDLPWLHHGFVSR
jgi:hypothetical protein